VRSLLRLVGGSCRRALTPSLRIDLLLDVVDEAGSGCGRFRVGALHLVARLILVVKTLEELAH